MNYICNFSSPVGPLTVCSDGTNITGLWIEGQKYFAGTLGVDIKEEQLPIFDTVKAWLDCYFSGKEPTVTLPLSPEGSPFRQSVWKILCEIPYGQTITYGEIAKRIARESGKDRMSAQAVGGAVGHNPISIIIPCHRVVGTNGSLTGYGGGIGIKVQLLKVENTPMESLYVPSKGTAL